MKFTKGTPAEKHDKAGHTVRLDVATQTPYCHNCGHHVSEWRLKKPAKKGITPKTAGELLEHLQTVSDFLDEAHAYDREEGGEHEDDCSYCAATAKTEKLVAKIKKELK